jgi:ABC-type branched-subunit amino acid transport system substrate-binding protein
MRCSGRAAASMAAVSMLLLIASACGSSHAVTHSSSPDNTTSGPHGVPIVVGAIYDNVGATAHPQILAGIRARIDAINSTGGIAGHSLQLNACGSGGNPNTARTCALQIANSNAVAVLGLTTSTDASVMPVFQQAGIPVIGMLPYTTSAANNSVAFCFNGGVSAAYYGLGGALKAVGATKAVLLYSSNVGAASAAALNGFDTGVKNAGLTPLPSAGYAAGDTQFAPAVAKALATGANGVGATGGGTTEVLLVQAVRQQSQSVKIATLGVNLSQSVLGALGSQAEGIAADGLTQPPSATSLKGIAMFRADMDKYGGGALLDDTSINGWAAAYAFQQVASRLSTISRQSVLQAMSSISNLQTGGIYPPLSASGRQHSYYGESCVMNPDLVAEEVQGGHLVSVHPGQFFDPLG